MSVALLVLFASLVVPRPVAGQVALSARTSASVPVTADTVTSAGEAFVTGAVAGFVAGAVLGAILATDDDDLAGSYDLLFGMAGGALLGALVGGVTGLVVHGPR